MHDERVPRIAKKPKGAYHHGNLREAIVTAADRVVAEEGAGALTIRQVADRLGVTHAAIYHHFEDRTAMLAAVAEQAFDRLAVAMSAITDTPAIARFRGVGVAYLGFALDHPRVYGVMFGPEITERQRYAGLSTARERVFGIIRSAIADCQTEGFLELGSPDEHTLFCWSACHGLASLMTEGQLDDLDLPKKREILEAIVVDRVFTGLGRR